MPPHVHMSEKLTTLVGVVLSAVWKGECDGLGWEIGGDSGLGGGCPVGRNEGGECDSKMPMEDGTRPMPMVMVFSCLENL